MKNLHKMPGLTLAFIIFLMLAPEPRPITLALVGDLMIGRGVAWVAAHDPTGQVFIALHPWLSSADLAFGNLESPVSEFQADLTDPYNLCAKASGLRMLKNAGFDLLSIENNHKNDCAKAGPGWVKKERLDTASLIQSTGMKAISSPVQAVEVTIRGIRLVFLAADDVTVPLDLAQLITTVTASKQAGAVVIVSLHWGVEYQADPTPRQRRIAQSLADAGAALIIGHHPHIAQPADWVLGDRQHQPALVLYSLGNALFDQHGLPDTRKGTLAFVQISPLGVRHLEIIPFQIDLKNGGTRLLLENAK